MSRPQPGTTRDDTALVRGRLEAFLKEQTEDGAFRFKSKYIADDLESTPTQVGQLIYQLREDDEVPLEFEKLTGTRPTTWAVRRKTVCAECGHDHDGYDTTVDGDSHCYACGFPKQRRDDAGDE